MKTTQGENKLSNYLPTEKRHHLYFTDSTYLESSDSNMTSMGHYRIIADTMKLSGKVSSKLIFKPEVYSVDSGRFFITVEKSRLTITQDAIDGKTWVYKRLK
jgi:hypothetical protein